MNGELELRLQAYLDGELSGRQARAVERRLADDAEARQLLEALRNTRTLLAGNELSRAVPASREFYWSKIQRGIERAESPAGRTAYGALWERLLAWRRYLAPVAGVALVLFLAVGTFNLYNVRETPQRYLAEVENLSEHTASCSFRSHSENMFVVWVYDKSRDAEADRAGNDRRPSLPE
jgi:anti-sigma-K factor RskA